MSIKDKIDKLPDDAIISHIEYDHYAGGGYIDCSHADLKALSDSHTALLEAAKEHVRDQKQLDDLCVDTCDFYNLEDAIEEAGKL